MGRIAGSDSLDSAATVAGPGSLPVLSPWDADTETGTVETNLCAEVSLVVLDTMCVVEQVVAANDNCTALLASVLISLYFQLF